MDVLGLVKIPGNTQLGSVCTNIAQGRMGRLLHYVSQIAGQLQFAGAVHHIDFHFQGLAAYAGPGQAGHQAYLVRTGQSVWEEFSYTQEFFQISAGNGDFLDILLGQQLHISLAADLANVSLQISDAGLPGIAADDLPDGVIGHFQLGLFKAMLLELLGEQMVLGDHQLLFIRIRAEFNDLHPVQQRSRHRIQGVGRGDEHHIRQIKGNFDIMIPVGTVLLSVQNFQKCRTGVTTVVRTHFVDFVQENHRIGGASLGHGGHDPSGHGSNVGLPMTTNIRLVMDAAQGNTNHLPVHAPGDGISNGGLAHTGRSHQTQNLVLTIRGHFLDGHRL